MIVRNLRILALLVLSFFTFSCAYIVVPDDIKIPDRNGDSGDQAWSAVVTGISVTAAGDLHVDITIQNNTGEWSKLQPLPDKPAVLTTSDGENFNCDTVFVGTGGHRFAPGFQMRGYTTGKKDAPVIQPLFVECKGVTNAPGSTLSIKYEGFSGELDDYAPDDNKTEGVLELALDDIKTDLTYPVATPVEGLILPADASITALSENVINLLEVKRTENIIQFTWQNFNPSKFPLKTHIGTPPVIGSDGIIYGLYETLDIVSVPITPAGENMQWTTEVSVPGDVKDLYILLSVESKKPRTYSNYVIDITDK